MPGNLLAAVVMPRIGVWNCLFVGYSVSTVIGFISYIWPIWYMNQHTWENESLLAAFRRATE